MAILNIGDGIIHSSDILRENMANDSRRLCWMLDSRVQIETGK